MIDLLEMQKNFILAHLKEGDAAADFTAGNGHDTVFLSKTVGENGHVFAFDIQESAINSAHANLAANGCAENYILIHDSHHNAAKYIDCPIKAGMFNLGWLPGGDKSITTQRETSLEAIKSAIGLMAPDAVITVAVYPGHPEGEEEGRLICDYLATLARFKICATKINILNSPVSPYFIAIENKA